MTRDHVDNSKFAPLLTTRDISAELLAAIDHAAALAPNRADRAETIIRILTDWLHAKGHLRHVGTDEGTRPENLTSENDD